MPLIADYSANTPRTFRLTSYFVIADRTRHQAKEAKADLKARGATMSPDTSARQTSSTDSLGAWSTPRSRLTLFAVLDGLEDWRLVLGAIHAHFRAGTFAAAAALVSSMAEAADAANHHPDIDLRYPDHVRVVLRTHAAGGLTTVDVEVASQFSAIASRAGATSEPTMTTRAEIAIDTMDADRIRPFWPPCSAIETMEIRSPIRCVSARPSGSNE